MPKYNPNPLFPNEPLFEIHDFSELPKSPRYTLYCNGQEQTVYHTDSFDYAIVVRRDDAPVSVEVCVSDSFKKAVLRPQSLEIPFDREENHIRFSLPYKAKVSLELDNDLKRPLLILSSCYVAPRSKGETYYFRKGQIYNVGNLELKSGESAYLEEGCVVCGRIYSNMADNVRVSGNGILYGGVWHKPDENGGRLMASFYLGKHILVEGISVVDNGVWNVVPGACRDVIIRDVNIMSRLVTGDGIDIVGCEEVLVEDCFIRACDDCVCIKACALPGPAACCNVRDIKVRRCVLWNAEPGNALEIGYELRCNEVSDVVFEDCDIIHCEYEGNQSGGVLTIHNADRAKVHNVRYENIRIEDAQEKLVDIKILDCKYSLDRVRGDVENIVFRNIDVTGPLFPVSIIRGFEMTNEMHRPRDIRFENVTVQGRTMHSANEMRMVVELAHELQFEGKVTTSMIQTLIVDDENIERQGIKRLINSYALPFQVTLASSGKMALDFIRSNAVDLMLTDVRMPIMDGLQLAEAALNEKANLQIVLISGFSEFEYAKTAMKLGVKDYLLKPVNPVEFRNTMTRIAEQIMKQNDKKDKEQFTDLQMRKYVLTCLLNGTPSEFQRMEQRREKNFSHLFVKSGISAAAAKLFRILPEISAEQTYQIIESIWRAESMQKLCDILLPILDKAEQKFAETPVKAKKLSDLSKQYIAEHYREDISLQTISESLFISPQHLSSVFKRETGQGLANYLRAYRMKCAKELLKGTRKKVSVICKEVGYPNETYFCKIFRDLYGMSPQQYRDEGTNGKEQL